MYKCKDVEGGGVCCKVEEERYVKEKMKAGRKCDG